MKSYFTSVLNLFSTRELAAIILIITLLIIVAFSVAKDKEIKNSLNNCLRCLFQPIFIKIFLALTAFFILVSVAFSSFLSNHNLWHFSFIKDYIIWFLFTGLCFSLKGINNNDYFNNIPLTVFDNFSLTSIVIFVLNDYPFSLWSELLIFTGLFILAIINFYSMQYDVFKGLKIFTDKLFRFFGFLFFLFFIYLSIVHYKDLFASKSLIEFFIPCFYTISFILPAFAIKLYAVYENASVSFSNLVPDPKIKKILERRLFIFCNINFKKIEEVVFFSHFIREPFISVDDIDTFFKKYKQKQKEGEIIPFNLESEGFNPKEAMSYLIEHSLKTGAYEMLLDGPSGVFFAIGHLDLNLNHLDYTLEGDNQSVKRLHLYFLDLGQNGQSKANYNYFVQCARTLYTNALKAELSIDILSLLENLYLMKNTSKVFDIDSYKILIEKEKYPKGAGYNFIIQVKTYKSDYEDNL